MRQDEKYMQRAITLAAFGRGNVSPNPMVGCVLVKEGRIIGEGWHQVYGGPHAEVNAVHAVGNDELIAGSTAYVSLEPCAHYGKTPPCALLLVEKKVSRVVIGCTDPNPLVAGKGIAILQQAGIEVVTGCLEQKALELNIRFFTQIQKKRPYIILKWAQTADGFVARENYESKWISHAWSRQLVHKWRAEEDAILVGYQTAKHDDPSLTVRDWVGKNPLRLVIDKNLDLPSDIRLFDRAVSTVCYNGLKDENNENLNLKKVSHTHAIEEILEDLHQRKIQSLIVEGGSRTLQAFIDKGFWDEARVFTAPVRFERGIKSPKFRGNLVQSENIGEDLLQTWKALA
jgi:diaminohydroxyphosphoribosylaminopyrimidine deaminase / 5-amino-6-(5-phosphoribosylamino)uracil reductase